MTTQMQILNSRISTLRASVSYKIQDAERVKREYEKYSKKMDEYDKALCFLQNDLEVLNRMLEEIPKKSLEYRERRKVFIEEFVETVVNYVFDENYSARLDITPYGKDTRAKILLIDTDTSGYRHEINVSQQNGGLLQQTTALAIGFAIGIMFKTNLFFMDEAMNGGDSVKVRKLQTLLEYYTKYDSDNMIVMNEHNNNAYRDIECVIYKLIKKRQGLSGYVEIEEVINQHQTVNLHEIEQEEYV